MDGTTKNSDMSTLSLPSNPPAKSVLPAAPGCQPAACEAWQPGAVGGSTPPSMSGSDHQYLPLSNYGEKPNAAVPPGAHRTFEQKLSKAEKLVLVGKKVYMALAEARVVSTNSVSLDWISLVFNKSSILSSPFWLTCEEVPLPAESLLSEQILSPDCLEDLRIIRALVQKFKQITGFQVGELRRGRNYYKHSWLLINDQGEEVGSVSGGGHSQKNSFNFVLRGAGCTFAKRGWQHHLYHFSNDLGGKLARADLALDLFNGESGGVESVRAAYLSGEFDYNGRRPNSTLAGAWDAGHSRTYCVGARGSKSLTTYEKGHQFGLMDSKWWRAEVRFGNQDRILPLEMLIEPDKFFAGAYPFLCELIDSVEPEVILTKKNVQEEAAVAVVKRKLKWFNNTVAPGLVHLTNCFDAGMHGFMWLCDLAVVNADRPLPRSLRGIPKSELGKAMRNCLSPKPLVPAGLVTS